MLCRYGEILWGFKKLWVNGTEVKSGWCFCWCCFFSRLDNEQLQVVFTYKLKITKKIEILNKNSWNQLTFIWMRIMHSQCACAKEMYRYRYNPSVFVLQHGRQLSSNIRILFAFSLKRVFCFFFEQSICLFWQLVPSSFLTSMWCFSYLIKLSCSVLFVAECRNYRLRALLIRGHDLNDI